MTLPAPRSRPLDYVTPSTFELLSRCPLSLAFSLEEGPAAPGGPAQWLGDVCHRVLDRLVADGLLIGDAWEAALETAWREELDQQVRRLAAQRVSNVFGSAEDWPGYELKRARLMIAAARVRERLLVLPRGTAILTEVPLQGRGGLLRGRADLILRGELEHRVIDYKTGSVTDGEDLRPAYQRQLQLYALMEAETSGRWPRHAEVLPLTGPPIEVRVDPHRCEEVADRAIALLEAYNRGTPGPPNHRVNEDTCPHCPFAIRCPAFWERWGAEQAGAMLAVEGTVTELVASPLSGYHIQLEPRRGSIGRQPIRVRSIDERRHPAVREALPGRLVAFTRLRPDRVRERTFQLAENGRMAVRDETSSMLG